MHPYVIINCAMSADGKIALPTRAQTRISSEEDMERVYKLRNEVDAVLVGIGTILADDPKLTVKEKYVDEVKNPIRIVLDSKGRIPKDAKVLNEKAETMVCVTEGSQPQITGAEVLHVGKDEIDLKKLLEVLNNRGIEKLLVEGGERVIWSFLGERLADELMIYVGSMVIGGETSPTPAGGSGARSFEEIVPLEIKEVKRLGSGVLLRYEVK